MRTGWIGRGRPLGPFPRGGRSLCHGGPCWGGPAGLCAMPPCVRPGVRVSAACPCPKSASPGSCGVVCRTPSTLLPPHPPAGGKRVRGKVVFGPRVTPQLAALLRLVVAAPSGLAGCLPVCCTRQGNDTISAVSTTATAGARTAGGGGARGSAAEGEGQAAHACAGPLLTACPCLAPCSAAAQAADAGPRPRAGAGDRCAGGVRRVHGRQCQGG